jgi:mycothiol synthase
MLELRPSSRADDDAVLAILAAREAHDFEVPEFVRGFLLERWRVDEFNPATDAVVAEDDAVAIGYAALLEQGAIAFVAPEHESKGAGSRLLEWAEARAVQARRPVHRQLIAASNASAHELLGAAGYERIRSVIQMAIALGRLSEVPPAPEGVTLAPLDVDADGRDLHTADLASFAGNADYEPSTFESFEAEHLRAPDLDPGLSRVARRGTMIAGFTVCRRQPDGAGHIDLLAVDHSERRRGLGTTLLITAFSQFAAAGLHEARLEVASDNPRGLRLYERAGMRERVRVDVMEKPVERLGAPARS